MKFTLREIDDKGNEIKVTELDMDITQEEFEEYQDLYCECDYLEKHPKLHPEYVENYNGVSHGWICPKCKKFVQIG